MDDSVKIVDDDYIKRINSNKGSGRLHKGHSITAATASIPSKYQTIVSDNAERKGFLSKSKRFLDEADLSYNPGPGTYVSHGVMQNSSPSYSKKGTGGFASKDRQISKHKSTCSPGAGAYSLPSHISTQTDHNRAHTTSVFHSPIAQNTEDKKQQTPGPNQYEVNRTNLRRANNVTANAAFKSRSKRDAFNLGEQVSKPAPWHYHINESQVKDCIKVPVSNFKSKTERKMQPSPDPVPGPGSYKPHEPVDPVKKTIYPRKHYLCISAPAMPLPSTPPQPGPGTYEVVNYEGPERHYMSSSVFVSSTSRWTGGPRNAALPGPAHYRPVACGKQSFMYNAAGRWI